MGGGGGGGVITGTRYTYAVRGHLFGIFMHT